MNKLQPLRPQPQVTEDINKSYYCLQVAAYHIKLDKYMFSVFY